VAVFVSAICLRRKARVGEACQMRGWVRRRVRGSSMHRVSSYNSAAARGFQETLGRFEVDRLRQIGAKIGGCCSDLGRVACGNVHAA
jgi:hypothetical protein